MRKVFLTFILLATVLFAVSAAKKGTFYLKAPHFHEVHSVSPNGKWACGVFVDNTVNRAFVWNLDNNEITYLGPKGSFTEAWGVSDNGVVCGTFITTDLDSNGAPQPTGGYWKDGKLYLLKDENGKPVYSTADVITPDGQYIGGSIISGTLYSACVWKNGNLDRRLDSKGASSIVNAISDDGQLVAGFYKPSNRIACYWDSELKPLTDKKSFDNESYSISPNKRYILARDAENRFIYDIQTQEKTYIPMIDESTDFQGGITVFDDKSAIIYENTGALFATSYVYKSDGTYKTMLEWLKENWGVTIPKEFTNPGLARVSRDMKRVTILTINGADPDYGTAFYCPLAYISDQEIDLARPTSLSSRQVESTNNVLLTWTEPSANQSGVTGYRIYKDGAKLTDVGATERGYADTKIAATKATYEVCALYGTNESEKLSTVVNMKDMRYLAPVNSLTAYQSNYDNMILNWSKPNAGYDAYVKLHNNNFATAFGVTEAMTFWAAVKYNKDLVNSYSGNFEIKAVEFYPCQKAEEMVLSLSSNGQELLNQVINQDNLIMGQNNVVVLKNPVTLPANADITVTIKVVLSGPSMPLGMADDPSVEGANLISQDGTTWTSLPELTRNALTYNWMIGLLLSSVDNGGVEPLAPSLLAAESLKVSGYKIYRDNEKIADIASADLLNHIDKNVEPGKHKYGVEAIYEQLLASDRKNTELMTRKKDVANLMAPVNLTGQTVKDEMNLSWDMPEASEVGFTSWEYQAPIGYIKTEEWYYGVIYNTEKMRPFAGSNITKVKFMPLDETVNYEVVIYENNEVKYRQNIEQVEVNRINTITLNTPLAVAPNAEYLLTIKVSNAKDKKPMGLDTGYPYVNGRVLSTDGIDFSDSNIDLTGNMMLSMIVEKITAGYNPGLTYKVYVDGVAQAQTVTENTYSKSVAGSDDKTLKVCVAAVYPAGENKSQEISILVGPQGISSEEVIKVKVYPNPATSFIHIEGNISSASLFDLTGHEVTRTESTNTLEVGSLPAGVYLLKSTVEGKVYINKIQVVR